ncbi:MAG: hypothetical protein EXS36_03565 [Pedosphaera sp.]|nr:hypothetical protein [Pedosphaera sp.]
MKTLGISTKLAAISALIGLSTSLLIAAPQTGSAKVTSVKGSATVGGEGAKVNQVAKPGTVLTTGVDSHLDLYLGINGPTIRLLPESILSLDNLTYDDAGAEPVISTKLGLKAGKVAGFVKKTSDQSSYIIETPNATASIRGTKYLISVDGSVYVWEGNVLLSFRTINYNVGAGQAFDPAIPGVVDNPIAQWPAPLGPPEFETVRKAEPVTPISPISPRTK